MWMCQTRRWGFRQSLRLEWAMNLRRKKSWLNLLLLRQLNRSQRQTKPKMLRMQMRRLLERLRTMQQQMKMRRPMVLEQMMQD